MQSFNLPFDFEQPFFRTLKGCTVVPTDLSILLELLLNITSHTEGCRQFTLDLNKNLLPSKIPIINHLTMVIQRTTKQRAFPGKENQDTDDQNSNTDRLKVFGWILHCSPYPWAAFHYQNRMHPGLLLTVGRRMNPFDLLFGFKNSFFYLFKHCTIFFIDYSVF